MAKEICISSTPHETRLAILEDDQLAEIYYERENEYTLAGSIYNGRVTRVLPGMQSAFVDLGLERDAFLYVTDFIELEDQEETDELEKAAATGQAPREVRHPQGTPQATDRNGGRREERSGRPGDRRPESKPERRTPEEAPVQMSDQEPASASAAAETAQEQEQAGGGRWRGRRRRRGGRGQSVAQESAAGAISSVARPAEPAETFEIEEQPSAREIHVPRAAPHGQQAPATIVLPGESLSKYGGALVGETTPEKAAPPSRNYTSKPSTLIDAPITWDGSGLLPGESISRHRGPQPDAEPDLPSESEPAAEASAATEQTVEEERQATESSYYETETGTEEPKETALEFEEESLGADAFNALAEEDAPKLKTAEEEFAEEDEFEETTDSAPEEPEAVATQHAVREEGSPEEDEPEKTEIDASASHRVDPSSPTGFRLFGFGKKKKEEEPAITKAAAPVSTYAPGEGLVEEEVIEGEEFDGAPHARRHKPEVHDLDVYEEETLPANVRPGDLGEMFQEAHLDHRIQRNLDQPAGEEEEDEAAEEEETTTGTPPVRGRERGQRGRGGRGVQGRRGPSRRSAQTSDLPIISDLLKSGQEILVQIAKEPIAKKGARITSHIALPGRFLVFMPTVSHVGVSRKIASDEERHRLKRILTHERGDSTGGFIVRTAAEGASEEELRADLRFLMNLWNDIKQRSEASKSPALIYHDLSLIERILRDQVSSNFSNIWVDTEADYERIVRFLNRFSPSLVRRVKLYNKEIPLFEHFGIEDEISKALRSKVWLKSGGSIVINQTEALVAIDINTGKYVGKSARLEDTILKTNLDAVPEIVRQIRLRDLGGIIVIDFIDMDERRNRFKVMAALEEALKNDRAPTKVLQFNDFGLVAITRKRVKQSLERTLSVPCPTCQATGMVKSSATVCNEIYIELRKMRKHFEAADVMLRVHPETVKVLKGNNARWLTEFEELIGRNLLLKSDPTLHPEQFDIQG
ncbi:MAG TPA: Rne/Rng family ribonuclease [Terracidiphilus sp.]|nr:Rne/Rng family ribonuclease [Terracidiphilus sp.]